MPKTEIIHDARLMLKLPADLKLRLEVHAGRQNVSRAIRQAIEEWLDRWQPKPAERLRPGKIRQLSARELADKM